MSESYPVAVLRAGTDTLSRLRTSGLPDGVVLIATLPADPAEFPALDPTTASDPAQRAQEHAPALVEFPHVPEDDPARQGLLRAQRLVAAGEIALGLQHAMNNPLTALLVEAQLLELDTLAPEHHEAVARMIVQTRRVIDLVKRLDAVSERPRTGSET